MAAQDSPLVIYKYEATGNDFLILEGVRITGDQRASVVIALCDRHRGIGADGAVFIDPAAEGDFQWEFFNCDGSPAEMCGNAARAVALLMSQRLTKSQLKFKTKIGWIQALVKNPDEIEIQWPIKPETHKVSASSRIPAFVRVTAGVPHAVIEIKEFSKHAHEELALKIRAQPEFRKHGTNVTFFSVSGIDLISAWTFERGVDDFTLSCGTGAIAAAAVFSMSHAFPYSGLRVQVPGGLLKIHMTETGEITMKGPARAVAKIDWLGDV